MPAVSNWRSAEKQGKWIWSGCVPFLFEDADFLLETIRKLIQKGEDDAGDVPNKEALQNAVS